jgi:hypothetical protein
MSVYEERSEDGTYFRFDVGHDHKVWKARKEAGLSVRQHKDLTKNPNVPTKIYSKENDKIYNVERVYAEWHMGWHVKILAENNKSHVVIYWENINCFSKIILGMIEENRKKFKVIATRC